MAATSSLGVFLEAGAALSAQAAKGMPVFESITARILVEVVLLLGLVWIWSFFYKRSFEQPGPDPPDESD